MGQEKQRKGIMRGEKKKKDKQQRFFQTQDPKLSVSVPTVSQSYQTTKEQDFIKITDTANAFFFQNQRISFRGGGKKGVIQ